MPWLLAVKETFFRQYTTSMAMMAFGKRVPKYTIVFGVPLENITKGKKRSTAVSAAMKGPYIHHMSELYGNFAETLKEFCRFIPELEFDPIEE